MPQDDTRVSIREFGRYLGLSDTAIKKQMWNAVRNPNGPLKESICVNENNGRPMLWREMALTEWVAAGLTIKSEEVMRLVTPLIRPADLPWTESNPVQKNALLPENHPAAGLFTAPNTQNQQQNQPVVPPKSELIADMQGNLVNTKMDIYTAKQMKEIFVAGKHELEYRKMRGKLVDKDDVYKILFEYAQEIRQEFMQIPARVMSNVLACDNEREAKEVLTAEIERVLIILSRGPKEQIQNEDEQPNEVSRHEPTN